MERMVSTAVRHVNATMTVSVLMWTVHVLVWMDGMVNTVNCSVTVDSMVTSVVSHVSVCMEQRAIMLMAPVLVLTAG